MRSITIFRVHLRGAIWFTCDEWPFSLGVLFLEYQRLSRQSAKYQRIGLPRLPVGDPVQRSNPLAGDRVDVVVVFRELLLSGTSYAVWEYTLRPAPLPAKSQSVFWQPDTSSC